MDFQLHFHGLDRSEALAAVIEERAEKLIHFSDRLVSCQVFVEAPPRHRRHGSPFVIRIELLLPGERLVVGRDHAESAEEDPYQAVARAFDVMERRLVDGGARRRHVQRAISARR